MDLIESLYSNCVVSRMMDGNGLYRGEHPIAVERLADHSITRTANVHSHIFLSNYLYIYQ
jgi:hypothetical protein